MSAINGDKARFDRKRKKNIQRRARLKNKFGALLKAAPQSEKKAS